MSVDRSYRRSVLVQKSSYSSGQGVQINQHLDIDYDGDRRHYDYKVKTDKAGNIIEKQGEPVFNQLKRYIPYQNLDEIKNPKFEELDLSLIHI